MDKGFVGFTPPSLRSDRTPETRLKRKILRFREGFGNLLADWRLLVIGISTIWFVGCEGAPQGAEGEYPPARLPEPVEAPREKPQVRDDRIKVGDTLELFVNEDPGFDGVYKVREGGDIIIPRVGRISVAGSSVSVARGSIREALEQSQLTTATVIVDRVGRAKEAPNPASSSPSPQSPAANQILVYITGKVARPGQHVLTLPDGRPLGVYEAILIAGGMSRFGDEQKVHVLRAGDDGRKYRIPVNIREIEAGKAEDPPIGHGDIVVVPEKVFGF